MRQPDKSSYNSGQLLSSTRKVKDSIKADRDKEESKREQPAMLPEIEEEDKSDRPSDKSKSEGHQSPIAIEPNSQNEENKELHQIVDLDDVRIVNPLIKKSNNKNIEESKQSKI